MLGAARLLLALLVLLGGCSYKWTVQDGDGDGVSAADGDCWDTPQGPDGSGLTGADISPNATETWYDGVDQNCDGADDYDADGDGVESTAAGDGPDCDDTDPTVYPGADDVWYDGIDSDCAGNDDYDADGDGYESTDFGGPDCDDTNAAISPAATEIWYDGIDENCDGKDDYDQDGDGYEVSAECDDTDPARYPDPSIPEIWYNGIDENCDGNDGDQDGDGYVDEAYAEAFPDTWATLNPGAEAGDCWDDPSATSTDTTPIIGFSSLSADQVNPGETERYYDGVDQDCAGDDDFDQDKDGQDTEFYPQRDGTFGQDCVDGSDLDDPNPAGLDPADIYFGHAETWYDGTDQDCNGGDDFDQDGDGFDSDAYTYGTEDDCDDTLADVNPAATETCATLYDDDCDGSANDPGAISCTTYYPDADSDGYGDESSAGSCLCEATATYKLTDNTDCNDAVSTTNPGETEICDTSNTDENCNGLADDADSGVASSGKSTWYKDADGDGYGKSSSTKSACDQPSGYVSNSTDCDDTKSAINPAATEVCDSSNTDEDCDGLADDKDSSVASSGKTTWYKDADSDGYGDASTTTSTCDLPTGYVANSTDCNDASATINPGETEICDSANTDENCNGLADDADSGVSSSGKSTYYKDADGDGYGKSSSTTTACDLPSGYSTLSTDCDDTNGAINPAATEVCDASNTDEDCDGLADDADSSVASSGKTTWYKDADSDGYGKSSSTKSACDKPSGYVSNSTDCDDTSSSINPGATEVCDASNTDEDCDGLADDLDSSVSVATESTWYKDADGDGYGNSSITKTACDLPSGYVSNSTDCDDTNSAINPAAAEVCDAANTDEDCDGKADDDDSSVASSGKTTFYKDADGDGYGLSTSTKALCDLPSSGYATTSTDCDDTDALTFPGASETCEDGVVNDCDGTAAEAQATCMGLTYPDPTFGLAGAYADRVGEASSDLAGSAVSFVGDVNGDGYDDALIGSPAASSAKGRAYLIAGPWASGSKTLSSSTATARMTGKTSGDSVGTSLAGAGDVDGDGYDDMLIGATGVDATGAILGNGAAYVVDGPQTGAVVITAAADDVATGGTGLDNAGVSVAGVGDLTADGKDDILVGADKEDSGGTDAGAAYLLAGPPGTITLSSATATAFFTGSAAGDAAGNRVAAGGDIDGDGTPDLLIGAYAADVSGKTDAGKAYVIYGPATGTVALASADVILSGGTASDNAGCALAGGQDVDGDGNDDFVVGAKGVSSGTGAAYLFYGGGLTGSLAISTADAVLTGAATGDAAGSSVSLASDTNKDGFADVLVGAPLTGKGTAYLLYGPVAADLTLSSADVAITGVTTGDEAGSAVAGGGDQDADGYGDLIIGVPLRASSAGHADLIPGTSY